MQQKKSGKALFSKYKFILSSASPRRKELLDNLGVVFYVKPSNTQEIWAQSLSTEQNLIKISSVKCETGIIPEFIAIGADTIVLFGNEVIQKPADYEDAKNILSKLSGNAHLVLTAVTLGTIKNGQKLLVSGVAKTKVFFKKLSAADIEKYLKSINFIDKAGAYAFQHNGSAIIEKISGEKENIIGFPLRLFTELLLKLHKTIMNSADFDDRNNK